VSFRLFSVFQPYAATGYAQQNESDQCPQQQIVAGIAAPSRQGEKANKQCQVYTHGGSSFLGQQSGSAAASVGSIS
jgi:hypothetical protein